MSLAIALLAVAGVLAAQLPAAAVPGSWSGPTRVIATPTQPRYSMVVAGGKTHVAAADDGIVYATNAGGSWTRCRISGGDDREPSIAIDPVTAMVHVAFVRRDPGQLGIHTASGAPPGGSGSCGWDVVERHAGSDASPSLGARGGILHIAFRSGGKLRYIRGAWDTGTWSVNEVVDGTCCQSAPALALTSDGGPRVAFGDSSADGLKYAARSGSTWNKRRVHRGRILHVALVIDQTPDPWNGLQPANSPNIAYVVKGSGTHAAGKGGSGVSGSWWINGFGRYTAPPDLDVSSNKFVIIFGRDGRLWAQSRQGGIYVQTKISGSGRDGYPQIMLNGANSVVTFARARSNEGVYRAEGHH